MSKSAAAMQAMAVKYLELARTTTDPGEREKLRKYADLYREMAVQANTVQSRDRLPRPLLTLTSAYRADTLPEAGGNSRLKILAEWKAARRAPQSRHARTTAAPHRSPHPR